MGWIIKDSSLDNNTLLKNESIFHTANGYLGVRGNFEESYPPHFKSIRGSYLNGFYDINEITYGEKLYGFPTEQEKILNVMDAQGLQFYVGDEKFSLFEGEILDFERSLNMRDGYTERYIHWRSSKGHEFKITIRRMTSFVRPELFLMNYSVESVNYNGSIHFISTLKGDVQNFTDDDDPRVASGHAKSLSIVDKSCSDGIASITCSTKNSGLTATCCVSHHSSKECIKATSLRESDIIFDMTFDLSKGSSVTLDKFAVYTDSVRHPGDGSQKSAQNLGQNLGDGSLICMAKCRDIKTRSGEFYLAEQKAYLREFWDSSDVQIHGDASSQEGLRFNLYHLLQSAGRDKFSNIAAKGLSGEGYEGHYFWDTEIYMIPFFLLTNREVALNLLKYRHGILPGARRRASEMGHRKGALYPWRTITGRECSAFFPAGTAQYHINGDVAYSFINYFMLTDDIHFMGEYGAEVLFETARLWMETGHFLKDQFRIDCVTGPDEYTCVVNNNFYTNKIAKHNLNWAFKIYIRLKTELGDIFDSLKSKLSLTDEEASLWQKASNSMYLPYDKEMDLNPQDDTFLQKSVWDFAATPKEKYPLLLNYHPLTLYRYQVCKQADTVLSHMLLEDGIELSTMKNSFDYYEGITTHDSSLSYCIFSIMASRVGYREKAFNYFKESIRLDIDNTHGNTKDGIHAANMGGTYLSVVYGFAGLRVNEECLSLKPFLPEGWDGYSFKVKYKNSKIKVSVTKDGTSFALESGDPVTLKLFHEFVTVA